MITRILIVVLVAVVLVGLALLAILAVSAALLGTGAILTRFFDVTLFQAAVLTTAVTAGLAYVLNQVLTTSVSETEDWEDEDEDWEDEDWDDEDWEDDEEPEPEPPFITRWRPRSSNNEVSFENVGRNDPCPCGSGKKFKYCHGRKRR